MAEKHTTYFIIKRNKQTNALLKKVFVSFSEYQHFIVRRPLPSFNSKLTNINDIPINHLDTATYSVDYNTDHSGFGFDISADLIFVCQVFDIGKFDKNDKVMKIVKSCYEYSIAVISGFEIDILIDDYKNSLCKLLADRSLYPIFAKAEGLMGYQQEWEDFKVYTLLGSRSFEELREMVAHPAVGGQTLGRREELLAEYLSSIKKTE